MFIKPVIFHVIFHSIGLMDIDANTANVRVEYSGGVKENLFSVREIIRFKR
jgi:hypothetical protein